MTAEKCHVKYKSVLPISNFGTTRKWQTWTNCVSTPNFALKWWKMLGKMFLCLKLHLESKQWEKHVFEWLSQSEVKLHMLKILNTKYVWRWAKQMKWRNLSLKNRIIIISEVANMLNNSMGLVQGTLKDNLNKCYITVTKFMFFPLSSRQENQINTCQDFHKALKGNQNPRNSHLSGRAN